MDATLLGFREPLDGTIGDNCSTLVSHSSVARWGPQRAAHEFSTVIHSDVRSADDVRAGMGATLPGSRELLDGTIGDNCSTLVSYASVARWGPQRAERTLTVGTTVLQVG